MIEKNLFIESNMKFQNPKREKIPTQIVQQIRSAILNGELKPGEPLPNEQDLVQEFGVSKHTLREALRTLEGMGFLSIKRGAGGGPVVSEIDWETARDSFSSFLYFQNFTADDIHEVRKLIEPYITYQATLKMTEEYFMQLQDIHNRCLKAYDEHQSTVLYETEVLFHVLLAKIAGNPILWVSQDFVNNMLTDTKHNLKPSREFTHEVLEAHQKILDAIQKNDPQMASDAMLQHILEVESGLHDLINKK